MKMSAESKIDYQVGDRVITNIFNQGYNHPGTIIKTDQEPPCNYVVKLDKGSILYCDDTKIKPI